MEGIVIGILLMIGLYLVPTICFFATLLFACKAIKKQRHGEDASTSSVLAFSFTAFFLFFAFIWPGDFQIFLQNTEFYRTLYMVQLSLLPLGILIFCSWYRKEHGTSLAIRLLSTYGLIDILIKAPRIAESLYKIATGDHRPYQTGFSAFISRYSIQLNLVTTALLLIALYALYINLKGEQTSSLTKKTGG